MDSNEKWFSVKEVAGILSVSADSVRRWIDRGNLPAFRFPTHSNKRRRRFVSFRIAEKDLESFIIRWKTGRAA